jgi:hypothetical protein
MTIARASARSRHPSVFTNERVYVVRVHVELIEVWPKEVGFVRCQFWCILG